MAKKLSTTPKGKAVWPRLAGAPDFKYNTAGTYSTKILLSAEEGAPIVAVIDEVMNKALGEAKVAYVKAKAEWMKNKAGKKAPKEPVMMDAPYFVDEETGEITLSFKMVASGENRKTKEKFTQKPVIFDAKGQPVTTDLKIGSGSVIRVSYELLPFATALGAGASLRLKAVQIIELVEFGGDPKYYGFDSEEGFSGDDAPEATPAAEMGFTDEAAEAANASAAGSESDDF